MKIFTFLTKKTTLIENIRNKKRRFDVLKPPFLFFSIFYSTVTDFAKLRGWSTFLSSITAI